MVACGSRATRKEAGPDEAMLRKLDAYLQCHLDHSQVVFRTEDLYRHAFADAAPGPDSAVVMVATPDPTDCLTAIAAARAAQPAMPELDTAGAAFAAELARVNRLTSMYDRAKAAQLHGELMGAFDAFDQAQAVLFDQLYALNRKMHIAQFAKRANQDDSYARISERTHLAAEDVVRFAAVPWDQLDKVDTAGLEVSIAEFERAIDSLYAYERQDPERLRGQEHFYDFRDKAGELATAARQLVRRAHDKVPYTDSEKLMIRAGNEAGVIGTPAAMANAYNRLTQPS
jgi:hypothetical protein